jgi:hypothetical protein
MQEMVDAAGKENTGVFGDAMNKNRVGLVSMLFY